MIDQSPDAILVHADGRFVFANEAAAELLAAEGPKALVGLPIEMIVHPDYRELVDDRAALEQLGQVAPLLEEKFIRLDGREILVEVAGIPVKYEGRAAGQIVVRDISRRKEAEEQLRSAEERYRALVEHIPAVVYVETPEGDPERFYISPQVEDVFGCPAGVALDRGFLARPCAPRRSPPGGIGRRTHERRTRAVRARIPLPRRRRRVAMGP